MTETSPIPMLVDIRSASAPVLKVTFATPQPTRLHQKRKSLGDDCPPIQEAVALDGDDVVVPLHLAAQRVGSSSPSRRSSSCSDLTPTEALDTTLECRAISESRNMFRPTAVDDYKFLECLGSGAGGKVKLARGADSSLVAIKVCRTEQPGAKSVPLQSAKTPEELVNRIRNEAHCLHACGRHPNVTRLIDFMSSERKYYMVTDYVNGGDLFDHVIRRGSLPEDTAKMLFRQLILGVKHIHSRGVGHRDIKPENLLLARDLSNIKVCDFGFAVRYREGDAKVPGTMGTVRCLAPEMIRRKGWENPVHNPFSADVWSCGTVLYFMLSSMFPFEGRSDRDTLKNTIAARVVNPLPKRVSPEALDLFSKIFQLEPERRPTCDEILSHPYLQD